MKKYVKRIIMMTFCAVWFSADAMVLPVAVDLSTK